MEEKHVLMILGVVLGLSFFALWLIRPTPEDIRKCQDTTTWSYDRCELELSK